MLAVERHLAMACIMNAFEGPIFAMLKLVNDDLSVNDFVTKEASRSMARVEHVGP